MFYVPLKEILSLLILTVNIDELLKHSTGERIHMYLQEQGAMVIRQDNNDHYTYVVTPVHTHN